MLFIAEQSVHAGVTLTVHSFAERVGYVAYNDVLSLCRVLLREDIAPRYCCHRINTPSMRGLLRKATVFFYFFFAARAYVMIPYFCGLFVTRRERKRAVNIYIYLYVCVLKRERHLENYGLQHANVINVGNNSVTRTYARARTYGSLILPHVYLYLSRWIRIIRIYVVICRLLYNGSSPSLFLSLSEKLLFRKE